MSDQPQRLSEEHMGYRVDLSREQCLGGWEMTYYSVFRLSDGWEAAAGYTEEETALPVMMAGWKRRIEAELREADPWEENAKELF